MMTMPATIESCADHSRIRLPIREALAPSATNTVEKPSTNISASRHHRASGGLHGLVMGHMLDGRAGEIDQIGRDQRQHARGEKADKTGNHGRRNRNIVHYVTFENGRRGLLDLYEINNPEVSWRAGPDGGHRAVFAGAGDSPGSETKLNMFRIAYDRQVQDFRMRIGIRSAISALVLTSIVVSAVGVHLLWWRTAQKVSQTLADTINEQIVSAVGDELQSVTTEARSSLTAVRTLLTEKVLDIRDARRREFVFLSQLQSQPTISSVAFGWPDGSFFAGHKLGEPGVEMLEITMPGRRLRIDQYEYAGNDIRLKRQPRRGQQIFRHRPGVVSRSYQGR